MLVLNINNNSQLILNLDLVEPLEGHHLTMILTSTITSSYYLVQETSHPQVAMSISACNSLQQVNLTFISLLKIPTLRDSLTTRRRLE